MSILLIIVIIIVIIIIIVLIAAGFMKNEYTIERHIIISKSKEDVFNYIRYLKNQENYNKWVMTDPNMKKEYKGTDGTPGFAYAWDSSNKQVGKGEQEIKSIIAGERIDHEIRFIKPFNGVSHASMIVASIANPGSHRDQTQVTWDFNGRRNYPMKIVHFLFNLKKMLGQDLEISLANLKAVIEK